MAKNQSERGLGKGIDVLLGEDSPANQAAIGPAANGTPSDRSTLFQKETRPILLAGASLFAAGMAGAAAMGAFVLAGICAAATHIDARR